MTTSDASAIEDLTAMVVDLAAEYHKNTGEVAEVAKQLAHTERHQRRIRALVGCLALCVLGIGVGGFQFHRQDVNYRKLRTAQIRADAERSRQNSVAGCERSNESRATLRDVINLAIGSAPPPPNLSPELADLYRQSQARAESLRTGLLALPGVQPVDCAAAYPPPPPPAKR